MAYPTDLDALQNGVDDVDASHVNTLQEKVGKDSSADTDSHDYKLSGVTGSDKAASKTGTETLTNKTLTSPTLNLGSDATGDIYYRDVSGNLVRLPAGSAAQYLEMSGGIPAWQDIIDEDDMSTDSATRVPSQQSVKAYMDRFLALRMRAYRTTSALALSGETDVVFNTESYDPGSDYNTTTGVYTVPSTGVYIINTSLRFTVVTDGNNLLSRIYNGANSISISSMIADGTGNQDVLNTAVRYLTASDSIKVTAEETGTGEGYIDDSVAASISFLEIQRIA